MKPLAFAYERRRIGYAVLAVVLALLCVFPQPFVARAKLVPQDKTASAWAR